jgi:hypothetical protein
VQNPDAQRRCHAKSREEARQWRGHTLNGFYNIKLSVKCLQLKVYNSLMNNSYI